MQVLQRTQFSIRYNWRSDPCTNFLPRIAAVEIETCRTRRERIRVQKRVWEGGSLSELLISESVVRGHFR